MSWPFLFSQCRFSHASLHRSAAYSQSLVLSNKPGDRFDAELDDCSDVLIVMEPQKEKESHWEGMLREWKRRIARKPDCLNSGRAKLTASISAWETAALGTLGSMYVKSCPVLIECLWESSLNHKCMLWVYVGTCAWPEGKVPECQKYAVSLCPSFSSPKPMCKTVTTCLRMCLIHWVCYG